MPSGSSPVDPSDFIVPDGYLSWDSERGYSVDLGTSAHFADAI